MPRRDKYIKRRDFTILASANSSRKPAKAKKRGFMTASARLAEFRTWTRRAYGARCTLARKAKWVMRPTGTSASGHHWHFSARRRRPTPFFRRYLRPSLEDEIGRAYDDIVDDDDAIYSAKGWHADELEALAFSLGISR